MIQFAKHRAPRAAAKKRRSQAKYRKGAMIRSIGHLDRIMRAGRCVYYRHKVQSPGWLIGMQYRTLRDAVDKGWLRVARRDR